jgi:cell division protein FtsL
MQNSNIRVAALGKTEKRLFYLFLAAATLLLITYLYFWQASLFNIVSRERASAEIGRLTTEVAAQEADYIALASRQITLDQAKALGFSDVSADQNYAVSGTQNLSLSLSRDQI